MNRIIKVQGSSMFPSIMPWAKLETRAIRPQDIAVGDVICYLGEHRKIVAHRVISIEYDRANRVFITRGDAQKGYERVEETAVTERVCAVLYPFFSYRIPGPIDKIFTKYALCERPICVGFRLGVAGAWSLTLRVARRLSAGIIAL